MADLDDLARRLAAHPRWEWRAGMVCNAHRLVDRDGLGIIVDGGVPYLPVAPRWVTIEGHSPPDARPDLTDPATAGVLLAMLAEAVTSSTSMLVRDSRGWHADDGSQWHGGDCIGEAVARALLAVWGEQ